MRKQASTSFNNRWVLERVFGYFRLMPEHRATAVPPPILLCSRASTPSKKTVSEAISGDAHSQGERLHPAVADHSKAEQSRMQDAIAVWPFFAGVWKWILSRQLMGRNARRLQVTETVSLGDKRFVAVIQVDGHQYLVGGGATNISLLAQLNSGEAFRSVLTAASIVPSEPGGLSALIPMETQS